jgi:putative ABC transport system substrate-binding protein
MRRREFIAGLSIATLGPFAAIAQQSERIRRTGVLLGATSEHDPEGEARVAALRHGLEELGWVNGRNVRIDYRFAGGDTDRIRTW